MILIQNKKQAANDPEAGIYSITQAELDAMILNGMIRQFNVLDRKAIAKSDSTVEVMTFVKNAKENAKAKEAEPITGPVEQITDAVIEEALPPTAEIIPKKEYKKKLTNDQNK